MTVRRLIALAPLAIASLAAASPAQARAAGSPPAGGAALGEVIIATSGALVLTATLLVLGMGHRFGRVSLLGRGAHLAERSTGLPGWVALPTAIATTSLIVAVFGMYWDISLHIDQGRDPGPLANPAHYFILIGLFGIFAAGFFAIVLPLRRPSASAIRLSRDWHAPLGGVLICACGLFSLLGFPLDDIWHRLFGQDVTLWGPTHLMLIGGAAMTLVGIAVLAVEGLRANRAAGNQDRAKRWVKLAMAMALTGGFMLGLSTFQAEFDFGVPQFRLVFDPILTMLAAGVGLVSARFWGGRGAALGAVAFFLVIRGLLAVTIGPILGEATPHLPLYLAEALVVEIVALRLATGHRPLAFGVASGVGIGTVGLAAEWAWSHVWRPLPWPTELLPEGALLGFAAAVAGGLLGAWIGARLSVEPRPRDRRLRSAALLGAAVVAVIVVYSVHKPAERGMRAIVVLTDAKRGPDRTANATVTLSPRDAADGAAWFNVTAWQGGGLVLSRLERIGPGRYRTAEPVPVHGKWKAMVRLHRGASLTAVPVYLPPDSAIPVAGVPAPARFERAFESDHKVLQREQKTAAPALTVIAYGAVVGIALALLALLAWGLHRLSSGAPVAGARSRAGVADPSRPPALAGGHR
ncbi:MAG: hypothetical protein NVS2B6_03510 [Thermoleophilaceae bacterium]